MPILSDVSVHYLLDNIRYFGKIIAAVTLLACAGCVSSRGLSGSLSIDQLLADPSKFDRRTVFVIAYANIEFEMDALCDVPGPPRKRCLWLTYDDGPYETEQDLARYQASEEKWRALDGKRVLVHGTFVRGPRGHFGMYPGEINRITGVKLAP